MANLSKQNLQIIYTELDQVGVAVSIVGTRRQKLMELARLVVPIGDSLVGMRPEVKRVRDDLVRLAHNVRRAQVKPRLAARAIKALALQVKVVQKLLDSGLGDVPHEFGPVNGLSIVNEWGYTKREVKSFLKDIGVVSDSIDKMGLTSKIGTAQVVLDPEKSPRASMTYSLFDDMFFANPSYQKNQKRGMSDALGGRLWIRLFDKRDVETWGSPEQAWKAFSYAFYRLVTGKGLGGDDAAKLAATLGRHIGPEKWRKVA